MLQCQKIMAMPLRRHVQVPVAYMSKGRADAVLAHPDPTTPAGRRDAVMLRRAVRHRRPGAGVDRPERPRRAPDDAGAGAAAGQGRKRCVWCP